MRYLYTVLLYVIQPFIWLKLWFRGRKAPAYRTRIQERYGFSDQSFQANGLWFHCVSVGETLAAVPLIKQIQQRHPNLPITITTMTPTGSDQVKKQFSNTVQHVLLPYDLPCAMSRLINKVQPQAVVIMETELWPNFLHTLQTKKIPVLLANGRLSARSAKGYGKVKGLMTPMLQSLSHLMAQYPEDAERYLQLGANTDSTEVCGNIKFDIQVTPEQRTKIATLKTSWQLNARPVWIAASTHEGEETEILKAHKQLLVAHPDLLLILVPRHPERFAPVARYIEDQHLQYLRRTQDCALPPTTQVLLGDTMGELMTLMGLANIAFVGGSLIERGGHNPLEPAAFSLPIIMGPHTFNFAVICQKLTTANGLITVHNAEQIAEHVQSWLIHPDIATQVGHCALNVLKANQGALEKQRNIIESHLSTTEVTTQ